MYIPHLTWVVMQSNHCDDVVSCQVRSGTSVAQLVERSVWSIECRGFESHLRQLIFSRKSDCLGCAVLLCLVCLFDLACFLSSFSSLI